MTDKSNKKSGDESGGETQPDQTAAAEASLREAREALGSTVDEVAHDLHLSREVVLALEAGEYEALGAPVFVRGHLRSYARLLGMSEDGIVADYQPYEPEPEEFRTLSAHTVVKPGASLPNFVLWALLVLLLLVGAGYLLIGDDESAASLSGVDDQSADFSAPRLIEDEDTAVVVELDEPVTDSVIPDAGDDEDDVDAEASSVATTFVETGSSDFAFEVKQEAAVIEEPAVVEQPAVVEAASAILMLRFSEECWLEVSDSRRRLLYGLEKPGSEVELRGTPPFKLFIGNIAGVDIEVAGRPFTVPQSGLRGGNTARFSIAKDQFE